VWPFGGATVREKLSDAGAVDRDAPIAIVPAQHRAGTARSTWHVLVVLLPLGRTVERGVLESRVFFDEGERYFTDRPVTLFGDEELGLAGQI